MERVRERLKVVLPITLLLVLILLYLNPGSLAPAFPPFAAGMGVGTACLLFQIVYNRGVKLRKADITAPFVASQAVIILFRVPAEEAFYRGVFFTVLASVWGFWTALFLSAALSTMITVVSSRNPIHWLGASLMGVLCGMGYYYTASIWTPVLIHVLNDIGGDSLNERTSLFTGWRPRKGSRATPRRPG